jgi:hypothetical protein
VLNSNAVALALRQPADDQLVAVLEKSEDQLVGQRVVEGDGDPVTLVQVVAGADGGVLGAERFRHVLRMDELKVVRYTLPSGQVVSKYVPKSDRSDVSLQETFHLQPKLDPPPAWSMMKSGRPDSNRRPSVPQTDALTRLRHAPLHCSSKWTDDRGVLIRYHERQFRCQEPLGITYLQAVLLSDRTSPRLAR